ncbi:MAG TPA: tRNA lysidine(34) synthetase TilS [Actinomycetales bacterium]|nr:tRNA lysidine(34) synthetase TilS [Actinomycetales bacterium]
MRTAVRAEVADLPAGSLVLVACSGGADSLALAAATAFVARRAGLRAGAVVVDHGWFEDSADVATHAAQQCRGLGLGPVEVVAVDARPGTGTGGPEAVARDARYGALEETAERLGAAAVLIGHTLEDQAETVLLALARGSGARSLAGMPRRRGIFRRPLLDLPRDVVQATCGLLGLDAWHDPSNLDDDLLRSRVRSRLLPVLTETLGPGSVEALARTAALLRADADLLEELAEAALAEATSLLPTSALVRVPTHSCADAAEGAEARGLCLDLVVLEKLRDAVRWRVLRLAALRAGAPAGSLAFRHVLALDALVVDWRGQGPVYLPGRVAATRACGRLSLVMRPTSGTSDTSHHPRE